MWKRGGAWTCSPLWTGAATGTAGSSSGGDPGTTPTGQATPITGSAVPGWIWAVAAVLAAAAVAALLFTRSRRRTLPTGLSDGDGQPGSH